MAKKKGPKMLEDLVRRRANGNGFQTIAIDLKIARNTVKNRLKEIGAYEVVDAQQLFGESFGGAIPISTFIITRPMSQDFALKLITRATPTAWALLIKPQASSFRAVCLARCFAIVGCFFLMPLWMRNNRRGWQAFERDSNTSAASPKF